VMPAVPSLSQAENAAVPEAFITAYGLLFFTAQVKAGDNVLVHAGASAVGQCLIQMASRKGARVVATTRSPEKVEACLKRGAADVIVLPNANFTHKALSVGIKDWYSVEQYRYYQFVFDPVGAAYLESNIDVLQTDGVLVLYGLLNNSSENAMTTPSLLSKILAKRISILPSTLRSRDIFYKADLVQCFMGDPVCGHSQLGKNFQKGADVYHGDVAKMSNTIAASGYGGHMVVQVDSVFPLEEVLNAHAKMRRSENIGKIVLSVSNSATTLDWFAKQLNEIKF
jgi:NADPH:quinone reductase-like Zn-dependent oxidoreductase